MHNQLIIRNLLKYHPFIKSKLILNKLTCQNLINHQNKSICLYKTKYIVNFDKFSTSCDTMPLEINYDELLKAQKDQSILIIDVREQNEINETGKLPESIHIPMGNVPKLITELSDDEFKKQFQKDKPDKSTKIIVSCRAGMRSGKVQQELQKIGFKNVYNYTGGWSEWESKQKK